MWETISSFGGPWLVLVLLVSVVYWYATMLRNVPPGPLGLPLLGYLPFLGATPPITFSKLSEKYGGVISVYLGSRFVVILNDVEAVKEALVKQAETFAGRPQDLDMPSATGLILEDGQFFSDHRRFAVQCLRNCGLGRSSLEPLILDEIQHFVAVLRSKQGAPHDFRQVLTMSMSNNVALMVLGRRFDYDDPWILEYSHNMEILVSFTSSVGIFTFLPWLKYIPGIMRFYGQKQLLQVDNKVTKLMEQIVNECNERQRNLEDIESTENYFNAFKAEQRRRQLQDPKDDTFSDESLKSNLRLFLAAGSETSSTTLTWFIIHMMLYPEIQRRVQQEIDKVIGSDRQPSSLDMSMTPYTMATIVEVQRLTTLLPLNVPHRSRKECYVQGYRIPKNSFVLTNIWHVHNDPKVFPEPARFLPERHLNSSGQFVKPDNMIVFSLGKRQCMGEALARVELYLYVTAMMQNFTFRSPEGVTASLEGLMNVTYAPKSFVTCAHARR